MPLVSQTLSSQIEGILKSQSEIKENPEEAIKQLADQLAAAVDTYIKSATVNIAGAAFTGTSSAGPVTGTVTGTGTIS